MPLETARQQEIRRIGETVGTAGLTSAIGMENLNAQILIDCLKTGMLIDPELFFAQELNVNRRDPETGGTLLHIAAAYGIRTVLRLLIKHPDTNYLARDGQGRLASALAYEVAHDYAAGRLLLKKEARQSYRTGEKAYGPYAGQTVIGSFGDGPTIIIDDGEDEAS
jgi:hypothetical protein